MPDLENTEHEPSVREAQAPPAPRGGARGAVLVGARIVTGTVGIAVAVATVVAAAWLPLPTISSTPSATTVVPVPTDQERVCAGPMLRLGSDTGEDATTASSIGTPHVDYAANAGRASAVQLQSTDSTTGVAPIKITLPPAPSAPGGVPLLAAGQTQSIDHGDITGFAAAECREASGDSWLVGGATTTGRTTIITMSNPGEVLATVDLTVYTENGLVNAAGTDGIVVPPGGQRILSLAGFAPGASSTVVRVQSRGSQIVANLQQTIVRTLEPGGVDVIGAVAAPATTVVIPGLILSTPDTIAERESAVGYDDLASVLRFFVPGTKTAKAQVTITPESGTAKPTVVNLTLDAGAVAETPLGAFPAGSYTVTVRSDVPILAAARASVYSGGGGAADQGGDGSEDLGPAQVDFAWFTAAPEMHKRALVAVGEGPSPELNLANPTSSDATVSVKQSLTSTGKQSGAVATVTVTVPAGGAVALPAENLNSYTLSGFDRMMVSVSYSGPGALASYTVSPTGPASQPIKVYRR